MRLETIQDLLLDQLRDIYSAETQLTKALPKLVRRVKNSSVKHALEEHLKETEKQVERLQTIQQSLGVKLSGKKCKAMEGLIEEGSEALHADGNEDVIDLLTVAGCQRIEHYEISAYETAISLAENLGFDEVADLLQENLQEEEAAEEKLSEISFSEFLERSDTELIEEEEDEFETAAT